MALPTPSLFTACREVATWLERRLGGPNRPFDVVLGSPAQAAAPGPGAATDRLNLFFYAFNPSGFFPDTAPTDPWLLRAEVLLTPFAAGQNGTPPGEGDLRILGEAMRLLHEAPIVTDQAGEPIEIGDLRFRLDAVYHPLNLEEINHLWSTQGDTAYRPSVAYEIALVPVLPSSQAVAPRLVGATGISVDQRRIDQAAFDRAVGMRGPTVPRTAVDVTDPQYVPRIAFLHAGALAETLAFDTAGVPASLRVRLAGDPAAPAGTVRLGWERWTATGFVEAGAPVAATPEGPVLDPDDPAAAPGIQASLPAATAGQYLLTARRTVSLLSGGVPVEREVRSNPLLVTVHPPEGP